MKVTAIIFLVCLSTSALAGKGKEVRATASKKEVKTAKKDWLDALRFRLNGTKGVFRI